MNKTKTIYFLSAIVLIIGCYALNLSYSLFVQTESKDIVNATVPILSYNLEQKDFPILPNSSQIIALKINNTGTTDMNYGIFTGSLEEGLTVQLVEKEDNNIIGTVASSSSKEVLLYVTNTEDIGTFLTFDLTATYSTVAIAEDFVSTSNIDTVNTVKLFSDTIIANVKSTESTYENKTVYSETLLTTPAEEISGETERLLLETEDDYTASTGQNSYYFRGNVIDNYVNFAGMCWRIVRIAGDGSIKLILEDQYTTCDDTETTNTTAVYTGNWSDGNKYVFGYDDSTGGHRLNFLNYEGGLSDSFNTFQTALAKKLDSSIGETPTNEQVNNTLASKLKIDEWCYDDKVNSTGSYGNEYYGAYTRIKTNKEPSLSCSGTKLTKFRDNTNMYVATLTADEIVFAGAADSTNYNYYLMNTYAKDNNLYWWSLSPFAFDGEFGYDSAFILSRIGALNGYDVNYYSYSRPTVSLASSVSVTGGEGTLESPYIIG